tara:strand:- start:6166 stop:6291 length:126 start_codon:yes stop_codon:yes gene_type:complete
MCCVHVGGQKLQERGEAEQTKRQSVFAFATIWVLVCGDFST